MEAWRLSEHLFFFFNHRPVLRRLISFVKSGAFHLVLMYMWAHRPSPLLSMYQICEECSDFSSYLLSKFGASIYTHDLERMWYSNNFWETTHNTHSHSSVNSSINLVPFFEWCSHSPLPLGTAAKRWNLSSAYHECPFSSHSCFTKPCKCHYYFFASFKCYACNIQEGSQHINICGEIHSDCLTSQVPIFVSDHLIFFICLYWVV